MNDEIKAEQPIRIPDAWVDLLTGLVMLASHPSDKTSPLHCEHDQLTIMADPSQFTAEEINELETLGFHISPDNETFYSVRFGST